jgi:Flp pilus assembly pilin Flp
MHPEVPLLTESMIDPRKPESWHSREDNNPDGERPRVNKRLFAIHTKLQDLLSMEEGQDLVEYALTVALIALGAVASMRALSAEINDRIQCGKQRSWHQPVALFG